MSIVQSWHEADPDRRPMTEAVPRTHTSSDRRIPLWAAITGGQGVIVQLRYSFRLDPQAIRRGRWKLVRWAPHIGGAGPDGRIELYDLATDIGERRDLAAARPELAEELRATLDAAIGDDPRTPYGLRTEVTGGRLVVTLHNGSSVPWREVRLGLGGRGRARARTVEPGTAISAGFELPAAGRVTARADFEAGGRAHVFRKAVPAR
ncbi:hypothetical protein [Nonomuraea sp. NPDC002799]